MTKKQFCLGKRVIALILILLMFFSYMPANVVYGAIEETQSLNENIEENIADEEKANIQENVIVENVDDTKDETTNEELEDAIKISDNETQELNKENIIEDNSDIEKNNENNIDIENELNEEKNNEENNENLEVINTENSNDEIIEETNQDEINNDETNNKENLENENNNQLQDEKLEDEENEIKKELTWQEILEYGSTISNIVENAEKNGTELSDEELDIYSRYKKLVYEKGEELALIARTYGTENFTEEEMAVYNAYMENMCAYAEEEQIQLYDINVPEDQDFNGSKIVSQKPFGEGIKNLCYLAYNNNGENHIVYQKLKYVVSDTNDVPQIGITPMSYCMNVQKNFIENSDYNGSAWNNNWNNSENYEVFKPVYEKLYSELSYAVSIGCKTYGTNNESQYSTGGEWQEDYYVTQSVIYIILDEYINNLDGENGILSTMNINLTPEQIENLKTEISTLYSGHSKDSLKIAKPSETSGHYSAKRQEAVLNAVNNMYGAIINYRNNIGDSSDGYDASINVTTDNTTLKYKDGIYTATVKVNTTGTINSNSEIVLEGPEGMTYTKVPGTTNEYEISIPAANIGGLGEIYITAKALFNENKTVTYISDTIDKKDENGNDVYSQNMAFFQTNEDKTIEKNNSVKLKYGSTVSLNGNKTWLDNDNAYNTRPESIVVQLLANGKIVDSKNVTKDNGWSWDFVGHPEIGEDGKKIVYTISEKDVLNYETTYNTTNGLNIINKLVGKTEIAGEKTWIDNNNAYNTRPESIVVQLLANGKKVAEKTVKADENGEWKYSFIDLDKYDENGVEYKYSISENKVENYEATINEENIINKLVGKTEIAGEKTWIDNNNAYNTRPESIVVQLLANGKKVAEKTVKADENGEWKYSFIDLDKYDENGVEYKYSISENKVENYETTINEGNIINKLQEKMNITGVKIWNDSNNDYQTRPESIVVQLLANGKKVAEKTVKADKNGKWEYAFTDLDKYDENLIKIDYKIAEKPVERYSTMIDGTNIINTLIHNHVDFEYDITQAQTVHYNSKLDPTPKTGKVDLLLFFTNTAVISFLGMITLKRNKKEGN